MYLYHGTSKNRLPSITQAGLSTKPTAEQRVWARVKGTEPRIGLFLTKSLASANNYAYITAGRRYVDPWGGDDLIKNIKKSSPVILRIDAKTVEKCETITDSNDHNALLVLECTIGPERIEVCGIGDLFGDDNPDSGFLGSEDIASICEHHWAGLVTSEPKAARKKAA